MRVLFIAYDGFKAPGAKIRCYDYAAQLRGRGWDAEVFSFKEDLGASFDGAQSSRVSPIERARLLLAATRRLLRAPRDTIFIVHKAGFHSVAPVIASILRGNKIIMDYDDFEYYGNPLRNIFFHLLARRASAGIAASKYLQEFLITHLNKEVQYVPGGTETDLFYPRKKAKKPHPTIFVWVGFVDNEHTLENITFLLSCFAAARNQADIRLELRISGPLVGTIAEMIAVENMKDVKIISWVPDLVAYLDRVHVGTFPLVENSRYNQSKSPGKLFQYMAMELPVVCSPIGECKEIVRDGIDGFHARRADDFTKKMVRLAQQPALRRTMGASARRRIVAHYRKPLLASRITQLLKRQAA